MPESDPANPPAAPAAAGSPAPSAPPLPGVAIAAKHDKPTCPPDPRDPTAEGAARALAVGRWITALVSVGLILLLVRVAELQTRPPSRIARLVDSQTSRILLEPRRGSLVDRFDRILAGTTITHRLYIDPQMIRQPGDFPERVGYGLGYDPGAIEQRIDRRANSRYVVIDASVSPERIGKLKGLNLEALAVEPAPVRDYPMGHLAAQLVGFVGKDNHGLDGLEESLDHQLGGVSGRITYWRDARKSPIWIDQDQYKPPVDGQNVRLTLDARIQQFAEEALSDACKQFGAPSGEMVVMQPQTGQILAMANYPSYDPNHFSTARPEFRRNRCVTDSFEPGSTFKPFVWSVISQLDLMSPNQMVDTGDGFYLAPGGRKLHDAGSHGRITWDQVLVLSSNIGMAIGAQRLHPPQLYAAVRGFGFGSRTGSGLPGEVGGLLHPLKKWSLFSMSSLPMGQEIAVTPLQLARGFSAIANGGTMLRPIFLMRDALPDDQIPLGYTVLNPETAAHAKEVLRRVVTEGTGRKANSPLYTIFGKTGTAQVADHVHGGYIEGKYTSSFIGSAPMDHPQVVVVCIVHNPDKSKGHYGGTVAAPAARDVIEKTLSYLGVPPDQPQDAPETPDAPVVHAHPRLARGD